MILSAFGSERKIIKPAKSWHVDASDPNKIRCGKCARDVELGPALPLDGNKKAAHAFCNCNERGKRVERELRQL